MNRISILFILLIATSIAWSQELNCRVVINAEQIQTTERGVFQDMETAFTEFLNNRKWTEDEFARDERIDCNIIINLDPNESTPASGRWGAAVTIITSRPVYHTDYPTVVFNFADRDFQFEYLQSQPLIFNENVFSNNITSLLAYYAYTIIGMDYDTFSELGGTKYFQIANQIVSNAQNSNYQGWSQFNSVRNRYWLSENLLSSNFEPIRKSYYDYHRNGLDIFIDQPDSARMNILEGLKGLQRANQSRPRSIITISFLDAKADELVQIFKQGKPNEKKQAFDILVKVDPSRTDTFKKILE
ncbi:MAG: DUF4835 domain-containing protein [Flammeovirgaceae bacterium]|nr:DUF4835 domain-containing protein [Flammeovirgaceae bacterium]MBE61164.1 DUF4835 domain-containing protein [Flammeovirgaceae bacterium]MBR08616.1 DUF4835 domain-containing protein [Rickettsiales bacterium]|tara:strand:- start:1525 stop:2427 length:903 start_codon:yes stop_codon:yes gene_type:complete